MQDPSLERRVQRRGYSLDRASTRVQHPSSLGAGQGRLRPSRLFRVQAALLQLAAGSALHQDPGVFREHREEGMDGVAPVDAQNASTSRLENPHSTRVSHTAHTHYFFARKKKIKDNDVSRTRLALRPGISNSLTGRLREDLSDGLRNYVRANSE